MASISAWQVEPRRDVAELVGGEDAQREADRAAEEEDWGYATLDVVTIPPLRTERLLLHTWQVALSRGSG
jgi:hypothetical protein